MCLYRHVNVFSCLIRLATVWTPSFFAPKNKANKKNKRKTRTSRYIRMAEKVKRRGAPLSYSLVHHLYIIHIYIHLTVNSCLLDAHDKIKVPPGTTSSQPGPKDIIRTDSSTYSSTTNWLRLYYLLLYYSSCETERMASAFHTHVQVITPSMLLCRSSAEEPDLPLSCERLRRSYLYTIRTVVHRSKPGNMYVLQYVYQTGYYAAAAPAARQPAT